MAGDFPGAGRRIHDFLDEHGRARPDAIAAIEGDARLSYAYVDDRVRDLARALLAAGIRRGDRVATLAPPGLDFWLTYLASVSVGAIWMGLNPRYQKPEYAYLLEDAAPALVFVRSVYEGRDYEADLRAVALAATRFVPFGALDTFIEEGKIIDDDALAAARAAVDPEDIAVIVYTSGTTGKPKGAMLSHRAIVAAASINNAWMGDGLDSTICAAPINHVGGLNNVCMNVLAHGGRIIFHHRVDLDAITELTRVENPSYLVASPTAFAMFAAHPRGAERLGSYKLIVYGGAPASQAELAPIVATGIPLYNVYGQTETCGIVTATDANAPIGILADTIGKPLPHVELRIGRPDGSRAPVDERGEIQVRGPLTMSGYFRRDDATREAFTADGWLRTGDLGVERADGNFTFAGRLKEMYKSGGYNIYPVEIELALTGHPDVAAAAVLPVPHPKFQEVGHAFIMPVPGKAPSADELKDFLRDRLANYKLPKTFSIEAALPLLPNSKIDKMALKRRLEHEGVPA